MSNLKTDIYKKSTTTGIFSSFSHATFDREEKIQDSILFDVTEVRNILWNFGSVGHATLVWRGGEGFMYKELAILSGSGKLDLHSFGMAYQRPLNCNGEIGIITEGFDDLDSLSIYINGVQNV